MKRNVLAAALVASLPAAGCGAGMPAQLEEPTATLDVVLGDDPTVKMALGTLPGVFFAHHKSFSPNYFHGRLTGTLRVEISRNGRDWVRLGSATPVDLALQAEGVSVVLHTASRIPAGTYAWIRLVAGSGQAHLDPGAEIGGERIGSEVSLAVGDAGELTATSRLSIPIAVAPGSRTTLAVDLNAEGWLSEENLEAGRIPATDVEAALSAVVTPALPGASAVVSRRLERSV